MDNFESILYKAQMGNGQAMEKLIIEYLPLINGLVATAGRRIDKEEFKQYLMIKFVENTKSFKKYKND